MHMKFFNRPYLKIAWIAGLLVALQVFQGCGKAEEEPLETLPMNQLALENLDAFQPGADNWSIAGGVESNRLVEYDLNGLEGTGILINKAEGENNENIFTSWTHGDLELELDFLMPKGSNSGIYLMGRYELQLLDSWGAENPQFSDAGGIYERWDDSRPAGEKGFEGSPPRMNAARAPGLWQHVKILFKAPEFNSSGDKVTNAKFEEVWMNGVLVQEDVEVTGPTRAAAFDDEEPEGPLMIQGDHGPVAFRNIRYKRYDKKSIAISDLTFTYYAGAFDQIPGFGTLEPDETGSADSLDGSIITRDERYALRYTGIIEAPNSGTYLFKLRNAGTVRMSIDGNVIFDQDRVFRMHELVTETVELESGSYDLTLEYIDHPNNWYSGLSLHAEGPRLRLQKLHASSSVPGGGRELPDLLVEAEDRVKVLRSFAMHRGAKRTHVVNTGAPNGMNFSYDMGQAALLQAWEGPFLNTNEMWINRGEPQTAAPAGPPITFTGKPLAARLSDGSGAWPDSLSWEQLDVKGYSIPDSGWPLFKYRLGDVSIQDHFEGEAESRRLLRTVRFQAPDTRNDFWFQLASGKEIVRNEAGEYVVDDRTYYLKLADTGGNEPRIVDTGDIQDLRIPLFADGTEAVIKYEIIW